MALTKIIKLGSKILNGADNAHIKPAKTRAQARKRAQTEYKNGVPVTKLPRVEGKKKRITATTTGKMGEKTQRIKEQKVQMSQGQRRYRKGGIVKGKK